MELKLPVRFLEHLPELSVYNSNYYKIPFELNSCSILYGKSDDDNTTLWELGNFIDGKFVRNCYLGESYTYTRWQKEQYINLLEANEEMIWT